MTHYVIKREPLSPEYAIEYIGKSGLIQIGGIRQAARMTRRKAETIAHLINADPGSYCEAYGKWQISPV